MTGTWKVLTDEEERILHVVFGAPLSTSPPQPEPVPELEFDEWIASTDAAVTALQEWRAVLECWRPLAGTVNRDWFYQELKKLRDQGLEDWADSHPADLDVLARVVTGQEP